MKNSLCVLSILFAVGATMAFLWEKPFDPPRDVRFEFHTSSREYVELPLNLSKEHLATTRWRLERPARFFVHGSWSSRNVFTHYINALLYHKYNFIAVNWIEGAQIKRLWIIGERSRGVIKRDRTPFMCRSSSQMDSCSAWRESTLMLFSMSMAACRSRTATNGNSGSI